MMIGSIIVLGALVLGLITDSENVSDVVGGIIVMSLPVALGVSIRLRSTVRVQRLDQAKMHEREQLARELHDTVAHHVSGIAIQAQAGRFLASTGSLDGAASALAVIEEEASRALAEMRSMIGLLRAGDRSPEMAPQRGIADITRLASGTRPDGPQIYVELAGDLDHLRPAVEAAVYRMAQESITNVVRHARHATHVEVRVCGDADAVRLTVCDNGDASQVGSNGCRVRSGRHDGAGDAARGNARCRAGTEQRLDGARRAPARRKHLMIRVLIADDQEIVRAGLAIILDGQPDIDVVGQAADGREAVTMARQLRPDVCLFDIRMPQLDGVEATRQLAGPGVEHPARGHRDHDLRHRRIRARGTEGRRPRVPAERRRT